MAETEFRLRVNKAGEGDDDPTTVQTFSDDLF